MRPLRPSRAAGLLALSMLAAALSAAVAPRTLVVCPAGSEQSGCQFEGDLGIQAAIDQAANGDTVFIRAGRYAPAAYRDVQYKEVTVRGYVVVDGKRLSLVGEPGTVLDGSTKLPTTAIAVRRGDVAIRSLEITGFRFDIEEDDTYEGHGIFVIDGRARIEGVTIRNFQKMGLTGRGQSLLEAANLRVLDGHVGVWLRESAYLRLHECIIRGNDSSAIAAYGNAVVHASNCAFERNEDDGLYTDEQAVIFATNSLILGNRPVGANAVGASRIWLGHSALFGNATAVATKGEGAVRLGPNVIQDDPRVDAGYRPRPGSPLVGRGDPDRGEPVGSPSGIGPSPLELGR